MLQNSQLHVDGAFCARLGHAAVCEFIWCHAAQCSRIARGLERNLLAKGLIVAALLVTTCRTGADSTTFASQ